MIALFHIPLACLLPCGIFFFFVGNHFLFFFHNLAKEKLSRLIIINVLSLLFCPVYSQIFLKSVF